MTNFAHILSILPFIEYTENKLSQAWRHMQYADWITEIPLKQIGTSTQDSNRDHTVFIRTYQDSLPPVKLYFLKMNQSSTEEYPHINTRTHACNLWNNNEAADREQ